MLAAVSFRWLDLTWTNDVDYFSQPFFISSLPTDPTQPFEAKRPELAVADKKSPSQEFGEGDQERIPRGPLSQVPQTVPYEGLSPEEKEQLQEERRKRLNGWVEQKEAKALCLTALKAATQAANSCRDNSSQRGKRVIRQ